MPHKLKKTRKKRGTRTVGWGVIGQHRGSGQKGHRKVGRRKHLASWVLRYEPDYFTKKGFHSPKSKEINTINVGELEELGAKLSHGKPSKKKLEIVTLDLGELGYDKLLGSGKVAKPFSIKVMSYSESALRKVKEAGGQIMRAGSNA